MSTTPRPRCTLVVADDDDDIVYLLALVLREEGYQVYEETSAAGVAARLRSLVPPPDLVIMDIKLGDQDARQVLAELRAEGRAVPVLLMSARAEVTAAVAEVGAVAGLAKPFTMTALRETVATVLGPSEDR